MLTAASRPRQARHGRTVAANKKAGPVLRREPAYFWIGYYLKRAELRTTPTIAAIAETGHRNAHQHHRRRLRYGDRDDITRGGDTRINAGQTVAQGLIDRRVDRQVQDPAGISTSQRRRSTDWLVIVSSNDDEIPPATNPVSVAEAKLSVSFESLKLPRPSNGIAPEVFSPKRPFDRLANA